MFSVTRTAKPASGPKPAKPAGDARPVERRSMSVLCLLALGIVYGDIGTSPLYAFKVAVLASAGSGAPAPAEVLGILSLIVWSLVVIVSVKYIVFVMRADNHGEGGILALLALVHPWSSAAQSRRSALILLGIFGAALLYGDGVITPAISVMSAVEGLEVVAPSLMPYVKPLTVAILIGLFLVQSKGTARIGRLFGPVMAVWFLVIALLGVVSIYQTPHVLAALNPQYAIGVFLGGGWTPFFVFGAVFLALTGGEALYADMGHVGRLPIRIAWVSFVLPALVLNYAGQAALMLRDPREIENPFYHLAPEILVLPLVVLATLATVIASQALISGVFSMTRQASQLGLWPRLKIVQTSGEGFGQIYVPVINWGLMLLTLAVALLFKTSDDLAAAYGVAVSGTMLITTVLLHEAMRSNWGWSAYVRLPMTALFVAIDLAFFSANLLKLPEGGWLPLVAGGFVFWLMWVWTKGHRHRRSAAEPAQRGAARLHRPAEGRGADPDSRHRRFRHPNGGGFAARPATPRRTQSRASRAPDHPRGQHRRGTLCAGARASRRPVARSWLLAGGGALRLHADAQPAIGAAFLRGRRQAARSGSRCRQLLRWSRAHRAHRQSGDGWAGRVRFRLHGAQRRPSHRLFQDSR